MPYWELLDLVRAPGFNKTYGGLARREPVGTTPGYLQFRHNFDNDVWTDYRVSRDAANYFIKEYIKCRDEGIDHAPEFLAEDHHARGS